MKLVVAIVDDKDADKVLTALTGQHISLTQFSSTGGLLDSGNSTLLIGVDELHVPQVMKTIAELASPRQSYLPYTYEGIPPLIGVTEAQVGGFLSYVLDVDHFEQV